MENKVDNKGSGGKIAIVGAIITALAGIITTIVSISGPILDKRLAIQTTQTREAFLIEATRVAGVAVQKGVTPTPVIPTATAVQPAQVEQPGPTAEPSFTLAPTIPPAPTATAVPASVDTQPQASATPSETILKVGDSWVVGNGLTIQLTNIEFLAKNQIKIHFAFTNTSKKVMAIKVNHTRDVIMTDDKGNEYKWSTDFDWEITSEPGTTRKDTVVKSGDVSRAKYFLVKLILPGIGSMQWKEE